jgi:2-polyprenyl-6-methoxyphenol hydroxylase-like FAD-dependent oxidoreductase
LGLLEEFLKLPHQEVQHLSGVFGHTSVRIADFTHLNAPCRFIALMPQWDFLDFVAEHGRRYPAFHLHMQADVTDLIEEGGRIIGVEAQTPEGSLKVTADLVIGADGRHSVVRERAQLQVDDLGAPMDVLWMRVPRRPTDGEEVFGRVGAGEFLVMIDRGDYWQCAYLIPKGGIDAVKARGLDAFRAALAKLAPQITDRVQAIENWDDVKLLTVAVNRLRRWHRPGLLCIGDAAHAMSPIGGVGVNLAVQDAVAAANRLAPALHAHILTEDDLEAVQRRREFPTRATQRLQVFIQDKLLTPVLAGRQVPKPPWVLRLVDRWPLLQRIPARVVGMGFRTEHVRTPARAEK